MKKKTAVESLLDNTRSRNIEIFLPSFPLKVQSLDADLDQELNAIDGSTKLNVEHIVALKRYVEACIEGLYNHTCIILLYSTYVDNTHYCSIVSRNYAYHGLGNSHNSD